MDSLLKEGYIVIPDISVNFDIDAFLNEQREFVNVDLNSTEFVLGGFGALGNPSSFHHPAIRSLRTQIYNNVLHYFQATFPGRRLEALFDRFCVRIPGKRLNSEAWHRDNGPIKHNDIIFGGWFNLDDDQEQYFSCVPSTQNDNDNAEEKEKNNGFVLESKKNSYTQRRIRVTVPPRSLLLFNQRLVHEIAKMTIKQRSYRLYMGWRITDFSEPLFPTHTDVITQQSIPFLPSGQTPSMFAQMHYVHKDLLSKFSESILPNLKDEQGRCLRFIRQGLVELNLAFEPYSEEDKAIFTPFLL